MDIANTNQLSATHVSLEMVNQTLPPTFFFYTTMRAAQSVVLVILSGHMHSMKMKHPEPLDTSGPIARNTRQRVFLRALGFEAEPTNLNGLLSFQQEPPMVQTSPTVLLHCAYADLPLCIVTTCQSG
jgi:hypothetical protein